MRLSVEGNIGCGKTSVLSRLAQEQRVHVVPEPVEQWSEWLELFYGDARRWGMSFDLNVLTSFAEAADDAAARAEEAAGEGSGLVVLFERSPLSNRGVFGELQRRRGLLAAPEVELYDRLWRRLAWLPDAVVYLRSSPGVSLQRAQRRARSSERGLTLEYLQQLHDLHERMLLAPQELQQQPLSATPFAATAPFLGGRVVPVYVVDADRDADAVYADVLARVRQLERDSNRNRNRNRSL